MWPVLSTTRLRVAEEVTRGEGPISFGRPPGRYCQWADSVPEEVVRLVQGGELEITEKGEGGWKTVNFWVDCVGESCGLLAVDGCIRVFDGVE